MEEAPVTAATGALGPVIAKLAALLGGEYKLRWRTRRDVKFIRSKLRPLHSLLWNIWEREELDAPSMALKMEALDLADDVDDAIFDFILSLERSHTNKRLVQTKITECPFQDFKKRASDVSGRCRRKWKEKKKSTGDDSTPAGNPRAYPFVRKDASDLVGMVEQRDRLIHHLVGGEDERRPVELQLKTATITGVAGMGKTTLADLVYEAIKDKFESRAFVSVARPGGTMREVFTRILQQVAPNFLTKKRCTTEEDLIGIISNFLKKKRYLIIIDEIWNWREWEMMMRSLPDNNLGSRIVGIARIHTAPKKQRDDCYGPNGLAHRMFSQKKMLHVLASKIGGNSIATGMAATMADLEAEGFDYNHPIVHMCHGTPLALLCMLSAVAQERDKQGQHTRICDVQDEIEKQVMENGIQNTPGFEPLVESLKISYDSLPHHMLKTCLLYCGTIYGEGYDFEKDYLVRRWIYEGFVYAEEEANDYFEELAKRGFMKRMYTSWRSKWRMVEPMMLNFLRWKSRQDNFITCSSEITPSYNNTCRIRRLCIYKAPGRCSDATWDPLSALDWYRVRSLVVYGGIERVPLEMLEGVRVLDLCNTTGIRYDHHLKDICGLVRLRHLLGIRMSSLPPEIARLQCLETLEARGDESTPEDAVQPLKVRKLSGFIGNLQQLKALELRDIGILELPREMVALQQLHTLRIRDAIIRELPKEIGELQQLKILDISQTTITELPREFWKLQQLKTLDISHTRITVLPKEIGKLQQLEHLLMTQTTVAKIPREIGELKKLKRLILDNSEAAIPLEVCALVEVPEFIHQALNQIELAGEMLSFQKSRLNAATGGLVVGAKQMHIPPWIKEHFNDLYVLYISICKLDEQGLKILREMPRLRELKLKFEVVPREPVVISSQGFASLENFAVDSRVPRVTFQEGAMPRLRNLTFQFQFYGGPPNEDPLGINHLRSLREINFNCNEGWYGADSPCIGPMIAVARKEAEKIPDLLFFMVCGRGGGDIQWLTSG